MNYKKNVISVILWLLSAIMAGTGAMMVTMPSAPEESQWIGLVIAGVWLAVTGLVAFLLSRGLQKSREKKTNVDNRDCTCGRGNPHSAVGSGGDCPEDS